MSALASSPESSTKEITDSNTKANRISSNTGEQKEDHSTKKKKKKKKKKSTCYTSSDSDDDSILNSHVTKEDILYYLEHPEKIEFKNIKRLRKKQRKEIKKRKKKQTGEKVENIADFIIEIRYIIDKIKNEEISKDKLHEKINILLKSKTPDSPDSPGSLDGLTGNEADAELLRRHRQNLLDGYLKEKGLPQGHLKLRSVSPVD